MDIYLFLRDAQHSQHTGWSGDAIQMPYDMPLPYSKMMEGGDPNLKKNNLNVSWVHV